MRADWIWMTHDGTGGSGALTCVALAGWPTFGNTYTTPRRVQYSILEFTDSTHGTLAQAETGIGGYDPVTGVLTRDSVRRTWDGANALPREGSASAASAITVGATAANVRITCAPTVSLIPSLPAVASGLEGYGTFPMNGVGSAGDLIPGNGQISYNPILIGHPGPFSLATMHSGAAITVATASLALAIYEIGADGLPGKKLIDFGPIGGANPWAAVGNIQNTPLATPIYLEPGWYYQAILAQYSGNSGSPRLRAGSGNGWNASPGGTRFASGATTAAELVVSGQSSLPDPAQVTGIGTSNNNYVWLAAIK